MCTGRVDLAFVFRAFAGGADGVIIGGCWPGECHYVTEGNYDALANMYITRKLLSLVGIKPERMRLEWIAASEGNRFAEVMSDFVGQVKELGPLGSIEELEGADLKRKLEAVKQLVPYLKLVEREKLRIPTKTEEAYKEFYEGEEFNQLFDELMGEKIAVSEILLLLREGPRSSGEISQKVGLGTSAVAKHMNTSSRQGLVRFDRKRMAYALA